MIYDSLFLSHTHMNSLPIVILLPGRTIALNNSCGVVGCDMSHDAEDGSTYELCSSEYSFFYAWCCLLNSDSCSV